MNILVLAAGQPSPDIQGGNYPVCLVELDGLSVLELLVKSCKDLGDTQFIFTFCEDDIRRYHLDNVARLLVPQSKIISVSSQTAGAACTALLAITYIDKNEELLIVNGNEFLNANFSEIIYDFRSRKLDAGTVVFNSIHPRYSYVRLNEENYIIEAAEKNPISRNATAGFYWYARGSDFISSAQMMVRKNASVDNLYYISPTLNEMVLRQARMGVFSVDSNQYIPLKTERQLNNTGGM